MGVLGWVALLLVVFVALGLAMGKRAWEASADGRAFRALKVAPGRTVAGFPPKSVGRLRGTAHGARAPIEAPLSRRGALCWRVRVERFVPATTERSSRWDGVLDEVGGTDFVVADRTGRALVRVGRFQLLAEPDERYGVGAMEDETTTPELEAFLRSHGEVRGDRQLRYAESIVAEGDDVRVSGYGDRERDPTPDASPAGYREQPERLVLCWSDDAPLVVSKP